MDILLRIITSSVISASFAAIYSIERKRIPFAAVGGSATSLMYILFSHIMGSQYTSLLPAAGFAVIYSEVLAVKLKAPATIFIMPSILPLMPGRWLYRSVHGLVVGNMELFFQYLLQTLKISLGVAFGLLTAGTLVYFIKMHFSKALIKNICNVDK